VITGPLAIQHLSADGSRLVTVHNPSGLDILNRRLCGPVQVWDMRNGRLLREGLADTDIWIMAMSRDGKHAAMLLDDDTLRLFDCDSGEAHLIELNTPLQGDIAFSRTGRWVCLDGSVFVDREQRRVVPCPKGRLLCFNRDDRGVFIDDELENEISVVELRTGNKIASATLGSNYWLAAPDGLLLLAWRGEGEPLAEQFTVKGVATHEKQMEAFRSVAAAKLNDGSDVRNALLGRAAREVSISSALSVSRAKRSRGDGVTKALNIGTVLHALSLMCRTMTTAAFG
jgi:hypothetical protein